ncbi:MAG: PIN domain-containing protein [Propionibacteriaceae bacterium]|nr:PIN domain-containing protein [Propionibacteriaceae bacterium]
MILVDSSVWIDYFNGADTPQVARLDQLLDTDDLLIGDLILLEVLRGFRRDADHAAAEAELLKYPVVPLLGVGEAQVAARRYRQLRKLGVRIRKPSDVVIASYCITHAIPLLYVDRGFDPFVKHLGLLAAPTAAGGWS